MIFDDYKVTIHILGDDVDIGSLLYQVLPSDEIDNFYLFINGYIQGKEAFKRDLQESKK